MLYETANVKVKELVVDPGKSLSMQRHQYRNEYWHISEGVASVLTKIPTNPGSEDKIERNTLFLNHTIGIPIGRWHQLSNQDFFNYIFYFAAGLREIGLNQEEKNKVAIFAYQSPIWLIADFGSIIAGAISIPIFNNISSENFNYQINDCKPSYLFIDNIELLNNQEFNFDNFKKIVIYQSWNNENIESDFIAKY